MERKVNYYMDEIDQIVSGQIVYPITCEIDPSNACNLHCSFCMYADYLKNHREKMSLSTFSYLISDLYKLKVRSITFTGGGEPLFHPLINEMIDLAHNLGFKLGLVTNGTFLHRLIHPEYFTFIRISIDSYDESSYRKVKGKNLFTKVISNVEYLISLGVTDVGLSYVICEDNCAGLEIAQNIANSLGVSYIQFKPAWTKNGTFKIADIKNSEDRAIVTSRYPATDNLPCLIAGLIGIIGADGKVYFCCQFRGNSDFVLGDLAENSFSEIWPRRYKKGYDISKCPRCRYQNYAIGYREFSKPKYIFLRHIDFL